MSHPTPTPTTPNPQQYHSTFSIPYPPHRSRLNTVDIHRPTAASVPREGGGGCWIVYLHGGAFRDPRQTPRSLLPSLPYIFHDDHNIRGIASLGYRLCAYPDHETDPWPPRDHDGADNGKDGKAGDGGNEGRGFQWPAMIEDVREGVRFLADYEVGGEEGDGDGEGEGRGCMAGEEWVVVGHSVGATMGMMLAMSDPGAGDEKWGARPREEGWGSVMQRLKGVVGIEGVYDFVGLRDAHLEWRDVYEEFTTAAFGDEEGGGWRRGDLISNGEVVRRGVEVVLLGHSKADELVEERQSERMAEQIGVGGRYTHEGLVVRRVECKGGHDEVMEKGVEVGRCVDVAVEALMERQSEGAKGGGR